MGMKLNSGGELYCTGFMKPVAEIRRSIGLKAEQRLFSPNLRNYRSLVSSTQPVEANEVKMAEDKIKPNPLQPCG